MPAEPRQGLTIKAALIIGFGLTFGLWLLAGYQFTRRMAEVADNAEVINARYIEAQELLSTVRAQALLGSIYVHDALLDPDPLATNVSRQRFQDTYRTIDEALQQYVPILDTPAERERVARLSREITEFRDAMLDVLEKDGGQSPRDTLTVLRRQFVPRREAVLRVSEEAQALNRTAFVQHQAGMAEIYRTTQRRVLQQLGLALGLSLGIALLATWYASRLEVRLQRQRARDVETARDLQRLSAKLITAQEEERRSIARELHDEVGQVLTAIKVELAVAQRTLLTGGGSAHLLRDAQSITDGALHTVRDLSHLLHPALLDDLGLPAAIDWYLRGYSKRHGLRVELLHEHMNERLTPETETAVYRIVQEALTNVAKHAQATICRVYLQGLPHTVLITVEDDGTGFSLAEVEQEGARRGLGLIGIRERAAQLKGTMRLETALGKGTRLTVELPARFRTRSAEADEAATADSSAGLVNPSVVRG